MRVQIRLQRVFQWICTMPVFLILFCWADDISGPIEKTTVELQASRGSEKGEAASFRSMRKPFFMKGGNGSDSHSFPRSDSKHVLQVYPRNQPNPLNFTALTMYDTGEVPPDTMGAVGMTQYIACCNGRIRSFSKKTGQMDGVLDMRTDTFFSPVLLRGYYAFHPQIRYDRTSDSWIVTMLGLTHDNSAADQIMIAVATGAITPNTKWSFFSFLPGSVAPARASLSFVEASTLGIDAQALYIGINVFDVFGFLNCDAFVIPKAPLLKGTLQITAFRDLLDPVTFAGPYTPQGVTNFDSDATEGYFIGVDGSIFGRLNLLRIANPGSSSPTISKSIPIDVLSTAAPSLVPHKGNDEDTYGYLDGTDDRLSNVHMRNKHLYAVHSIGTNDQGASSPLKIMTANGCRWYEIDMRDAGQPALIQAGTLYDSHNIGIQRRHYWVPAIMTNGLETVAIGSSTAGISHYIDAAYALRYASDRPGTLRARVLYTQSQFAYNPFLDQGSPTGRRWGKYSNISLDPIDNLTMWSIQEFCAKTGSYGCQVISIPASPPPDITSCTPSHISQNVSSIELTINGRSVDGSAFYDTPPDFVNRLSIGIDDLPILSWHVVNATQIKVTVSTMNVLLGTKTITLTNPDGQKKIAMNLITVN